MTDRAITFSGPMVLAVLGGRKTQTRRVLRHQPGFEAQGCSDAGMGGKHLWFDYWCSSPYRTKRIKLPFAPGDRLWVKETHVFVGGTDPGLLITRADYPACVPAGYENVPKSADDIKWTSPIYMPRSASRITLLVTDVRVERLQDISEADCIAEGPRVKGYAEFGRGRPSPLDGVMVHTDQEHVYATPRCWYRELWDSINDKPGRRWDDNPWVVAITFEKETST